ncbi:hypothetical protein AB0O91_24120 [Kitasatospora sp. NPDC089797]|uniref:hypothetical protein n=1 Tax=Kitasatospora sp. NPDC089797 TaxID=3155298 RepID=UPI0034227860
MKLYVGAQRVLTARELVELAFGYGIDAELFTGTEDESAEDRMARLDVAREVLRDLDGPAARFASGLMRTAERRRVLTWKAAA